MQTSKDKQGNQPKSIESLNTEGSRYQRIVESNVIGIIIRNRKGDVLEANDYYLNLMGFTRDDLEAGLVRSIDTTLPQFLPLDKKAIEELKTFGVCSPYEKQYIRKDGSRVWVLITETLLREEKEKIIAFVLNITERKQAEADLAAKEQRYRGLFEHMDEGYAFCQMIFENGQARDWVYLDVNEAFQTLTGLKDVAGKRVSEVIPGIRETDPALFDIYAHVALTGQSEKFETFIKALQQWFSISVYSQERGYFVAVFDVITERKLAEQALLENEKQSRDLIVTAQRQAQEMSLLDEIRTAISQELDITVILHTVVEAIAHTFEYQLVSLYLARDDRLILQHQVGYEKIISEIPLGTGITSKAILSGEPILLKDVHTDPGFLGAIEGIVSEIAVPLFQQDKVIGVLNVESTQGVELTQKDVRLIMALGESINIAFQRTQYYQAEHEQRILAEALADTAKALTSTPHLHEVLKHILANVGRVVLHENANIMLVEEGVARIVDCLGYSDKDQEAALTIRLQVADVPNLLRMSETGLPIFVPDTLLQESWVDVPESRWIRSYVGAPIQVKGRTVGFINLNAADPGFFDEVNSQRLQAFAHQAAVAVENAQLYAQIEQEAITDELTGVHNRRGLFALGQREVERAVRYQYPLSVLILDIDHFKDVNDTYGHSTGDQVLQLLSLRCLDHIRKIDILGRYGGDEFVILLPDIPPHEAGNVGERLRDLVADKPFHTRSGNLRITISLGTSSVKDSDDDLDSLIRRADKALYIAKQSGRNRLVG